VHIELTELLCCPRCGPPHGLIALVDRMEERRILDGRLDCPMCEARHAILEGVVYLDPDLDRAVQGTADLPTDAATIAAALLGPPDGPETLLLAGAAAALGPEIADLRPEAAVVTWGPLPARRHGRVHPVVPADGAAPRLRPRRLDGAVLAGAAGAWLTALGPALVPSAHVVVLDPEPGLAMPDAAGLTELASDSRAWVGVRD